MKRLDIRKNINSANSTFDQRFGRREFNTWQGDTCVPLHMVVNAAIKAEGGDVKTAMVKLLPRIGKVIMRKHFKDLMIALEKRDEKRNVWEPPVWWDQDWFYDKKDLKSIHCVHVSTVNPKLLAYTQNADKLLRDVKTQIKPGRYLSKFFGPESNDPVLTEAECKMWADKQLAQCEPAQIMFIENNDPDGWEWVYENSPESCMRYNRDDRYLDSRCEGEYHPVRAYAHKDNDLALAFIMMPGMELDRDVWCDQGDYVVSARTIINRSIKGWQRIYAKDDRERAKLRKLLDAMGYNEDDRVLHDQKLQRIELDDGTVVCPYFDNGVSVELLSRHLLARHGGDYDAQNSSGILTDEREECGCCGGRFDRDDLNWIEGEEINVCELCRDRNYVYGYALRHGERGYMRKYLAVFVESSSEYYHEDLLDHYNIACCDKCGVYEEQDDLIECEGDLFCAHCVFMDEVDEEWRPINKREVSDLDGAISSDSLVYTHPHKESAHIDNCYELSMGDGDTIYVHKSYMEDARSAPHFRRLGHMLVTADMLGEPINEPFSPDNISPGCGCGCEGFDILWSELCKIKEAA